MKKISGGQKAGLSLATILSVVSTTAILLSVFAIFGGIGFSQDDNLVEFALIHSTTIGTDDVSPPALFPSVIRVNVGDTVRIYNTSPDPPNFLSASPHDPILIAFDEDGTEIAYAVTTISGPAASVEGGFRVENGVVTVVEFVADQTGEFFITHRQHGHGIVGTLIVE